MDLHFPVGKRNWLLLSQCVGAGAHDLTVVRHSQNKYFKTMGPVASSYSTSPFSTDIFSSTANWSQVTKQRCDAKAEVLPKNRRQHRWSLPLSDFRSFPEICLRIPLQNCRSSIANRQLALCRLNLVSLSVIARLWFNDEFGRQMAAHLAASTHQYSVVTGGLLLDSREICWILSDATGLFCRSWCSCVYFFLEEFLIFKDKYSIRF